MAIKVKYSDSYQAKMKRIKRLPQLIDPAVSGYTKRDLIRINEIFHDGIKGNTLRLEKLADITIASKRSKGYSKPSSPLYGAGDDEGNRSYANMLNITKRGKSWKLAPSTRMHHSGKIKLSDLFMIHEHGAIVKKQSGDSITMIRIAPRPALLLSYRRYLIEKRKDKKEQSGEVKQAMTDYINKGNQKKLKNLSAWNDK